MPRSGRGISRRALFKYGSFAGLVATGASSGTAIRTDASASPPLLHTESQRSRLLVHTTLPDGERPAIAYSAVNAPSTIPNKVISDVVTSGVIVLTGAAGWAHPPGSYPNTIAYRATSRAPDTTGSRIVPHAVEFGFDGTVCEVSFVNRGGTSHRVTIDDQYVDPPRPRWRPMAASTTSGSTSPRRVAPSPARSGWSSPGPTRSA